MIHDKKSLDKAYYTYVLFEVIKKKIYNFRINITLNDLERLYDQWEENDDDELEEDELPPYKRKIQQPNLDKIMKQLDNLY
ncbi:unnamed protein product [Brugia pahangi]|uniref:Uncharacterized protein n=1 Tax=Brugia pahangi TaxID=6280 RepID=A0A0N4TY61_BRUPA|nr:unnamed protein product [Brugia pahangi]